MPLQILFDLKARLEHAAIAGTTLLQEDFRLRRAAEALAPLANVNPVFAKINAGSKALLNAPENERSTRLLDVLSLVDAVLYTQGVSHISGDLTEVQKGTGAYVQASFGELQPLLTALQGTGSGRTSLIRECWETHPDYFSDFRVLPHVVSALGDNYAEVTDLICEILMNLGASIIPLLKENFDPEGKSEMARRVRLVAKLAGERENDWFVSILPDSKKDIREAVIQALSLSQDNAQLLSDLCQSERGKLREAAMRSLAVMRDNACIALLQKEVAKKSSAAWCLVGVDTPWAADLTATAAEKFLSAILDAPSDYDYAKQENLIQYCLALCGKYSEAIRRFWLWTSEKMAAFSEIFTQRNTDNVASFLQTCFLESILYNPSPEMLDLAGELYTLRPDWFLCAKFLSDLIRLSPEAVYDHYAKYIIHENLLVKEKEAQKQARVQLMMILSLVSCQEKYGAYSLQGLSGDHVAGKLVLRDHMLPGFDRRWIEHLANHGVVQECFTCAFHPKLLLVSRQTTVERILMNLIDPGDRDMCRHCGSYYFRRTKITGQLADYLDVLIKCGWADWQGLMAHCAQKQTQIRYHQVLEQLNRLPVSNQEKAGELRLLDAMVKEGRISVLYRIWPADQIAMLIARLESDPNAALM